MLIAARNPVHLLFVQLLLLVLIVNSDALWSEEEHNKNDNHGNNNNNNDGHENVVEYGVDVSFPMHHKKVSTNYNWLPHNQDHTLSIPKEYQDMPLQPLGDRNDFYQRFMDGCEAHHHKSGLCWSTERARVEMSLQQPQAMQVCIHT